MRAGEFDVLVEQPLMEGLDLPEVALVIVLDADKRFFKSVQLIQTAGRQLGMKKAESSFTQM